MILRRLNRRVLPPTHPIKSACSPIDPTPHQPPPHYHYSSSASKNTVSTPTDLHPRLSASLIIINPLGTPAPDGFNYHTLLLERHHTQSSFSSAHVFPGGNLDPDDHLISKPTHTTKFDHHHHLQASLKTCAIRETFEESGILTGLSTRSDLDPSTLEGLRKKLIKKEISFSSVLESLVGLNKEDEQADLSTHQISMDRLIHVANFITPTALPKRWDTHFYMNILSDPSGRLAVSKLGGGDALHIASPDGKETVSMVWLSPSEAIRRSWTGVPAFKLAPPQFYLLAHLSGVADYRELRTWSGVTPRFVPEWVQEKSPEGSCALLALPGDPMHSLTRADPSLSPRRHRIFVKAGLAPKAGSHFLPIGVQRVGMASVFGNGWEDLNVCKTLNSDPIIYGHSDKNRE